MRVLVVDDEPALRESVARSLIAFVDRMREHGIDMPDPRPGGRIGPPETYDPQSAEFQAATRECVPHLSGGILIGEPGGEGGMATRGRP